MGATDHLTGRHFTAWNSLGTVRQTDLPRINHDVEGGYAADVWCDEPPLETGVPADERVLVTPHVAALTDTTYREICVRTAAAVAAILDGKDPDPSTVHLRRQKS